MNSWKVIWATVVIFGAGVITGAMVVQFTSGANAQRHQRVGRYGEVGSPGGMRFDFLRRIQRDLNLSADQRERIDKILKQSQERTRKVMEPVAPQLHLELQKTKADFREVLNPDQQLRFDELLKQQQRWKEQHRALDHSEPAATNSASTNSI